MLKRKVASNLRMVLMYGVNWIYLRVSLICGKSCTYLKIRYLLYHKSNSPNTSILPVWHCFQTLPGLLTLFWTAWCIMPLGSSSRRMLSLPGDSPPSNCRCLSTPPSVFCSLLTVRKSQLADPYLSLLLKTWPRSSPFTMLARVSLKIWWWNVNRPASRYETLYITLSLTYVLCFSFLL